MQAEDFDELALFRAIKDSGVRGILIGRRALVLLGLPVLTGDYDFWIHVDDIERFDASLAPLDLLPNRPPSEARTFGRYVLEGDARIDVLVARGVGTIDGQRVLFDDVWARRQRVEIAPNVEVFVPSIDDLIATKRFAARPKDAEDVRMLQVLKEKKP